MSRQLAGSAQAAGDLHRQGTGSREGGRVLPVVALDHVVDDHAQKKMIQVVRKRHVDTGRGIKQ
jgi:hypothetical protein